MTVQQRISWPRNLNVSGLAAWSETHPKPALCQGMTSVMPKISPIQAGL